MFDELIRISLIMSTSSLSKVSFNRAIFHTHEVLMKFIKIH